MGSRGRANRGAQGVIQVQSLPLHFKSVSGQSSGGQCSPAGNCQAQEKTEGDFPHQNDARTGCIVHSLISLCQLHPERQLGAQSVLQSAGLSGL